MFKLKLFYAFKIGGFFLTYSKVLGGGIGYIWAKIKFLINEDKNFKSKVLKTKVT